MKSMLVGGHNLTKRDSRNWRSIRETRDALIVLMPLSGAPQYRNGAMNFEVEAQKSGVVTAPHSKYTTTVKRGVGIALTVPTEGLVARVERLTDKAYSDSLIPRMVDKFDATTPVAQALTRGMKSAMTEMGNLDAFHLAALASPAFEEMLLNLAVAAIFPGIGVEREPPMSPEFRAGGADLSGRRRSGVSRGAILDISPATAPAGLRAEPDGGLRLGALTTIAALAADPVLRAGYPGLAAAASGLATPQIRRVATLGGNLVQRNR
jgi:hypothetical protein